MKPRIITPCPAAGLAAALVLTITAVRAVPVSADSPDTAVEARWVQAESGDVAVETRDHVNLTLAFEHGTVNGGGPGVYQHPLNAAVALTAVPDAGYQFSRWTGDAAGTDNPLNLVMDDDKSLTAVFGQDTRDPDEDQLTNYEEIVVYQSNPALWDSDEDGFGDGYEVHSGYSPPRRQARRTP